MRAAAAARRRGRCSRGGYVPHEVIVGYAPGPADAIAADATADGHAPAASRAGAAGSRAARRSRAAQSVTAAIARLRRQPGVAYAVPNYIAHAAGAWYPERPRTRGQAAGLGGDAVEPAARHGVNAPQAWANLLADHRPGGRGVVVAVLDTGVAYRNWQQFHESPDFGGTGSSSPYDFVANNRFPLDRNGHGTFVAGIVAESTNNGSGSPASPTAPRSCRCGCSTPSGTGDETTIAKGIRYAVNHRAQVINLSLEFLPDQVNSGATIPQIVSAINYAHRHGVMVVGAAGNEEDQPDRLSGARAER